MIYLIFKNGRASGYATVPCSSSDPDEVVVEITEQELIELLSDVLPEDGSYYNVYIYLSLNENGEVFFDEERYNEEGE